MLRNNRIMKLARIFLVVISFVLIASGCQNGKMVSKGGNNQQKPSASPASNLYRPSPDKALDRWLMPKFNQAEIIYVVNPGLCTGLTGKKGLSADEKLLLQSLQGIVAQRKAEIFIGSPADRWLTYMRKSYGFKVDDGKYVKWGEDKKEDSKSDFVLDLGKLINHYIGTGDIKGYVKMKFKANTFNQMSSQVNQACTLAGINQWIIVSSAIEEDVKKAASKLTMGVDISERKVKEYEIIKENIDKVNKDILIMQPNKYAEHLREYGIAVKAGFFFYSDFTPMTEREYVYSHLNMLAKAFGWEQFDETENGMTYGIKEDTSVDFATVHNVSIVAANWCQNLSIMSSMPKERVNQKKTQKFELDDNTHHYVTLLFSDGDNIQWMGSGSFATQFFGEVKPENKNMPFGWTITPNMLETMPHMMKYLYETMTDKEQFVCSVSGYAYNHTRGLSSPALKKYVTDTAKIMGEADMKYIALKGVDQRIYNAFAADDQIQGGFVMYGGWWDKKPGYIYWQKDKPFVHDYTIFWNGYGNDADPKYMAKGITRINNFSTDKKKSGAYTFIQVNCWAYKYSQLQKFFFDKIDKSKIALVPPNEFMEMIKTNLNPQNGKFVAPQR